MPSRKTIEVSRVKEIANGMLANSVDEYTSERLAIASLLEAILFATGNYHGYHYLPGVYEYDDKGLTATLVGDESRRRYY